MSREPAFAQSLCQPINITSKIGSFQVPPMQYGRKISVKQGLVYMDDFPVQFSLRLACLSY